MRDSGIGRKFAAEYGFLAIFRRNDGILHPCRVRIFSKMIHGMRNFQKDLRICGILYLLSCKKEAVSSSALFVAHHDGALKVSLETNMPVVIYEGNCKGCCLASFENGGALFADQHRSSIYTIRDNNEIIAFAGTGVRGSQDGPAGTCQFQQPIARCTELDSVAYVCDVQTNSIKNHHASQGNCQIFTRSW